MLESSSTYPKSNYLYIVHSLEETSSVAPQLNYISTNIVLELKVKLVNIKTEIKEIKKQMSVIHLSLINKIRHKKIIYVLVLHFSINIIFKT